MTAKQVPPSPAHAGAVDVRNQVERALLGMASIADDFDRVGARDRLLDAVECLYHVLDSGPLARQHFDGLERTAKLLDEVGHLLPPAREGVAAEIRQGLDAARERIQEGIAAVSEVQFQNREALYGGGESALPEPAPFRASVGLPRLHAPARSSLVPWVDVGSRRTPPPPPFDVSPPKPQTLEELAKMADAAARGELQRQMMEGEAPAVEEEPAVEVPLPYEPALDEGAMLRSLAYGYVEDLTGGRLLRIPNEFETWEDMRAIEQQLLNAVDALVTLGDAGLGGISLYVAESEVPDPERGFAAALAYGCIDGRDAIGAAMMLLKQSEPETHEGWAEGLALAPSPYIDEALGELCSGDDPDLVALALDVLLRRGSLTDDALRAAVSRSERPVLARAIPALGQVLPEAEATHLLRGLVGKTGDPALEVAVYESLLRRGCEDVLSELHEIIRRRGVASASGHDVFTLGALRLVSLAGGPRNLGLLVEALRDDAPAAVLDWVGRFGHIDAVDALVERLEGDDDECSKAAARALERLTGAGLMHEVEEPWANIELPPEAPPDTKIPTRMVTRIIRDPDTWRAWLGRERRRFDAEKKWRGGLPFTPAAILEELANVATPPDQRREAWGELCLVLERPIVFHPDDWVERQLQALHALGEDLRSHHAVPGAWPADIAPLEPTLNKTLAFGIIAPEAVRAAIPFGAAADRGDEAASEHDELTDEQKATYLPFTESRQREEEGNVVPSPPLDAEPDGLAPSETLDGESPAPAPMRTGFMPGVDHLRGQGVPFPTGKPATERAGLSDEQEATYLPFGAKHDAEDDEDDSPASTTADPDSKPPAEALPFRRPSTQPPPPSLDPEAEPPITLERYAWLCVYEERSEAELTKALAACGIYDRETWSEHKAWWSGHLSHNDELRRVFVERLTQYRSS